MSLTSLIFSFDALIFVLDALLGDPAQEESSPAPTESDKLSKVAKAHFDVEKPFGRKIPELEAQNALNFSKQSEKRPKCFGGIFYPCEGDKEYYLHAPGKRKSSLHASCLIEEHRQIHKGPEPYSILDIGGANAEFIEALKDVEGLTVSASDLRRPGSRVTDERYLIWDASKILENPKIAGRKWSCIVCITTIFYLTDNARNLADFYHLLAPKGLLIVNIARFLGMRGKLEEMVEFLNRVGYSIISIRYDDEKHEIGTFILQKTHSQLNFPILYDKEKPYIESNGKKYALYAPDPRFMTSMDETIRQKDILEETRRKFGFSGNYMDTPCVVRPLDPHNPLNQIFQRAVYRSKRG